MHIFLKYLTTLVLIAANYLFAAPEKVTLAVNDLVAHGVKESEAIVISEQLRAELMKSHHIRLIERSQMETILKEQGFQQSGCTSDACAVEVGQLLGVRNMVVGTVGLAGSYIVLTLRVIDVGTGQVIINESIKTKGGIDKMLESGITDVTNKLKSGLFLEPNEPYIVKTDKRHHKTTRAVLIGGGITVLIGGSITAITLLNLEKPEQLNTSNTRIDLP